MLRGPRAFLASATALLCAPVLAAVLTVSASATAPAVAITTSSSWPETAGGTDYVHIVGEVLNSGGTASQIKISISLRAADNHEVGSSVTYADASVLGQGERSPFEDVVRKPGRYDHFFAVVTAAAYPGSTAHLFTLILDACQGLDPMSAACQSQLPQNRITGSVRNDNPVTVENVAAMFTFLDASGGIIAQNTASVASGLALAPGAAGNFVVDRTGDPSWSSMRFMAEPDYPLDLNPTSLDFGDQLVGGTSPSSAITITNSGSRTVSVSSATASGDFAATGCPAVAAGSSCKVDVTFTPTQMGARTGTLTIVDTAAGTPQAIALSGNGTAPVVAFSPDQLTFPTVNVGDSTQLPVTVKNTGTAPLSITHFSTTGDFTADGSACPASIAPQMSCGVLVTFAPRQDGPRTGQLTVTDNAAGSPHHVDLSGPGLGSGVGWSPAAVAFGDQSVGMSVSKQVTVTNTGHAALTIQAVTPPAGVIASDTCRAAAVAPAGTCTVTLTYAPTQVGPLNGNLTLVDNAGDSPQSIPVTGNAVGPVSLDKSSLVFGSQPVGSTSPAQTVTVKNTGSGDLPIGDIHTTGAFSQTNTCPQTLPAGQTCAVNVKFAPDQPGSQNGTLVITAGSGPQSVSLSGSGARPRWTSLGGPIPAGATVASWGPNRLDVFVRGTDQGLWHQSFDGTAWSNWQPLGGVLGSDPVAVSWGLNRIDIFVRGTDSRPWHMTYDNGTFNTWQPMNGLLGSPPAVSSWGTGHLDLFTRGTDAQLWRNSFDGGQWSDWQPLGGVLDSQVAAVSFSPGHIDVFTKGTDNNLWQQTFDQAHGWGGWQPHYDGVLASPPAAASVGLGRIDLFVRGTDNRLWRKTYNGTWANWSDSSALGGIITSMPAAAARGTTILDVFARGSDAALWQLSLGTR